MKLTAVEKEVVQDYSDIPIPTGMIRTIYKCLECNIIQAHDYVAYGLGRGIWRDICHCNLVQSNSNLTELKTIHPEKKDSK